MAEKIYDTTVEEETKEDHELLHRPQLFNYPQSNISEFEHKQSHSVTQVEEFADHIELHDIVVELRHLKSQVKFNFEEYMLDPAWALLTSMKDKKAAFLLLYPTVTNSNINSQYSMSLN